MQKIIEKATQAAREIREIGVLAVRAFINRMFYLHIVTATEQQADGFHVYEYEGVPSVEPGMFVVRFRHRFNGEVRTSQRLRMTHREWLGFVDILKRAHSTSA
jgi:hypothetical protein